MKTCIQCNLSKNLNEFYLRKDTNKYRGTCISCMSAQNRNYRDNNTEAVSSKKRTWQKENPEKKAIIAARYYSAHKEEVKEYIKQYQSTNISINARIASKYRTQLSHAIRRNKITDSFAVLIGCDIDSLKNYLESKFREGMTWGNYGEWQIDHIKPYASYDLQNEKEMIECLAYRNLQPLWATENRRKGKRI